MSCGALARPSNDLHFQPQSWYKSSLFMERDIDEWECLFWRGVYCKQSLGRQGIKDYREPRDCCSPIYLQMKMSSQSWKAAKQTEMYLSTFFILPMETDKAVAIHFAFVLTYFCEWNKIFRMWSEMWSDFCKLQTHFVVVWNGFWLHLNEGVNANVFSIICMQQWK